MAKKRTVALFEVMHASQANQQPLVKRKPWYTRLAGGSSSLPAPKSRPKSTVKESRAAGGVIAAGHAAILPGAGASDQSQPSAGGAANSTPSNQSPSASSSASPSLTDPSIAARAIPAGPAIAISSVHAIAAHMEARERGEATETSRPISKPIEWPSLPARAPVSVAPQPPQEVLDAHTHRRLEPKPSIDWTAEFAKLRGRAVASVYPLWENLKKQQIWSSGALPGVLAAMMVIGGIEFVRRSHHPAAAQVGMATTLEEVQQQTPQPSVLEVASYKQLAEDESDATPPAVSSSNSTPSGTTSATGNPGSTSDADLAASDAAAAAKPPSIDSAANGKRQVNMNYVLIQSYGDEKTAEEARDYLIGAGVPCTIERGVRHWRKDLYLVIGLQGFTRARGSEYTAYKSQIEDLSAKFAPEKTSYRGFSPMAIKWDQTN